MIAYTPKALQQVRDLILHYERRERPEAVRTFLEALNDAERKIALDPGAGLFAPRPYPKLAQKGRVWMKSGRYWVAYSTTRPPVITSVFYETSNIPGRI